ncbi:MAG: DUF1727 domain-containing protein [Eggerthellaceae bacterium]|nr:DUF1727 domain-containing protein [Eggerthellaceae bacterium]
MGIRLNIARLAGAGATWALKNVFRRSAGNFPGKIGLYADPMLIADLRERLREGSIVVVGTNGKTTVSNLLADTLEADGKTVVCNRTGANLDSGIATALLRTKGADWGVLECDELWLAHVLPQLLPDYVVLLNLFRDQLDRSGEIDHVQGSIVQALQSSPKTTLIYNADDPLCQKVANAVENACIPFGIEQDLGLEQNTVADASMCQQCDSILEYEWHQYGQLGSYRCPSCGFHRMRPILAANDLVSSVEGISLTVQYRDEQTRITTPFTGTYMAYNVLAVCAAAACAGTPIARVNEALLAFDPHNGRLQRYRIDERTVLLNLAKNPTGFNQNLRIILETPGPKAVAFFINDKEADGHDVSWLWDIDFQELAQEDELVAFAGGIRSHDMQVRLKYAGIAAQLVDDAEDFLAKAQAVSPNVSFFLIANYTALPHVKEQLDKLTHLPKPASVSFAERYIEDNAEPNGKTKMHGTKLTIVHMYPELLNLYGDGGNVIVLERRARARGIDVDIVRVEHGQKADLTTADIVFLGGGPDREQHLASIDLLAQTEDFRRYVEDDGVLLAICGGYQMLGQEWLLGDEKVPGLGLANIVTKRAEGGSHNRLVGNIALHSPLASLPVIGYENHAGRTFLGDGCEAFGAVIGHHGKGNNDKDAADGVRFRNIVGTYLHGPLLAKNPEIADWLIERALERKAVKAGLSTQALPPLDDAVERAANAFMCSMLNVHV